MSEKDLPNLIAKQRQLLIEESVILELLKKVRDEMHKYQIEQLQLESMIMTEDESREGGSSSTVPAVMTDMDSTEKINAEELDLSVSSSLNRMLQGQFYSQQEEEEEEEEEEEDEEETGIHKAFEEFILPL